LQRQSLKQVSSAIRGADSLEALQQTAMGIRRFARTLLGQGVQARQLTQLVSHLNDLLTQRLLALVAQRRGLDLRRLCWLALGSEGRNEQTIATDQDNALILADDTDEAFRVEALAFAAEVNEGLDACGFPLCKGGVMAREADCCLTLGEWTHRFDAWMAHGAPKDLLHANIFFDFRPLAGRAELAQALREEVTRTARTVPRFHQQLALNALQHAAPLNWLGAVDADASGGLDLKLQGTALFVDAARILALAQGIAATSTRDRLVQAGVAQGATPAEYEAWASGFEFLQMLRMQNQLQGAAADDRPNWVPLDRLNAIDRRILRETFRVARALQQRLQMDYQR
jgi:CBS domain-containing protein